MDVSKSSLEAMVLMGDASGAPSKAPLALYGKDFVENDLMTKKICTYIHIYSHLCK